jgi:uncharacterized protein YoxC
MYEKSAFVFWTTLVLYCITLVTVSYVGVYLTYFALPVIIISGLFMKFSKPNKKTQEVLDITKSTIKEAGKATNDLLNAGNSALEEFNSKLESYNKKVRLIGERTQDLKEEIRSLRLERIPHSVSLDYAKTKEEKEKYKNLVDSLNAEISILEQRILVIKQECELEYS